MCQDNSVWSIAQCSFLWSCWYLPDARVQSNGRYSCEYTLTPTDPRQPTGGGTSVLEGWAFRAAIKMPTSHLKCWGQSRLPASETLDGRPLKPLSPCPAVGILSGVPGSSVQPLCASGDEATSRSSLFGLSFSLPLKLKKKKSIAENRIKRLLLCKGKIWNPCMHARSLSEVLEENLRSGFGLLVHD